MLLLFSVDRLLATVAAEAERDGLQRSAAARQGTAASGRGTWATAPLPPHSPERFGRGLQPDDPRRERLQHTLELALVGEPERLADVLTPDAEGWSPTLTFSSRAEAEEALLDQTSTLFVTSFGVDRLCWSDPFVFAEWHLEARQTRPLLIGEAILIEGTDRPVSLVGASVAETEHGRIASLHTYFDDAALIEQVVLDRTT